MRNTIQNLLEQQLSNWELAKNNYNSLAQVRVKELKVGDVDYKVQFNPARIVSSAAKIDSKSIQERKCFLCLPHLPAEQKGIPFADQYTILVNPFPIFPRHLTIPDNQHVNQLIEHRIGDMLNLAATVRDYVIFYNGPKCGASAPDHAHFQAGNKGFLPIERQKETLKETLLAQHQEATLWLLNDAPRNTLLIESTSKQAATELFKMVYTALELKPGEVEPMLNVLVWFEKADTSSASSSVESRESEEKGEYVICLFPRTQHRPSCFSADGDAHILISPASVDMGGVFITPRESDFEKITATDIATILSEVCLSKDAVESFTKRLNK